MFNLLIGHSCSYCAYFYPNTLLPMWKLVAVVCINVRSSLIHLPALELLPLDCSHVAPPRLFTPAWTVEAEQLQSRQNGSNLISVKLLRDIKTIIYRLQSQIGFYMWRGWRYWWECFANLKDYWRTMKDYFVLRCLVYTCLTIYWVFAVL